MYMYMYMYTQTIPAGLHASETRLDSQPLAQRYTYEYIYPSIYTTISINIYIY